MLVQEKLQTTLHVRKLSPHIGAEITGVDLRQPVDGETKALLNRAILENVCMVIRDQHFTPEEFARVAELFGEVQDQDHPKYSFPGLPTIKRHSNYNLDPAGNRIKEGLHWHTDGAFRDQPPKFTMLYAVELPDAGGNTNVVNMRAAYRSLPEELRQKVDAMRTNNVRMGSKARYRVNTNNVAIMAQGGQVANQHPLVRSIDDTGEKGVWFNPNTVENIIGMDPEESQNFLYDLMDKLIRPEFTYSHQWRLGDLFMWDNRSSMHKVNFDYDWNQHRLHYHATTRGERPH